MKTAGLFLLTSLLLLGCASTHKVAPVVQVERVAVEDSVVIVRAWIPALKGSSCGTGFAAGGYIYTAEHVVKGTTGPWEIITSKNKTLFATGWRRVSEDVAILLFAEDIGLPELEIAESIPEGVFNVETVSNWYGHDGVVTITRSAGVAQVVTEFDGEFAKIADISATWIGARFCVKPGMSGGPVLHKGKVIALLSAYSGHWPTMCASVVKE